LFTDKHLSAYVLVSLLLLLVCNLLSQKHKHAMAKPNFSDCIRSEYFPVDFRLTEYGGDFGG